LILFWNETLHVSDSSSVHYQEYFTLHTAVIHVMQVLRTAYKQDQDDPACKLFANRYDVYHCCVYSEVLLMMDRGTIRNM